METLRNHRRHRRDVRLELAAQRAWWQNLDCPDFQEELGLLHGSSRQHSNQVRVDGFAGIFAARRR